MMAENCGFATSFPGITPVFPQDIKAAFDYLDSDVGLNNYGQAQRFFFKAICSVAYATLGRHEDLANLSRTCVWMEIDPESGRRCHMYDLGRSRGLKDLATHKVRVACIDTKTELDAFYHLECWFEYVERLQGSPLQGKDFVFPSILPSGVVMGSAPMSRSWWNDFFAEVIIKSGWDTTRGGRSLSTTSLRRGAVQYWSHCGLSMGEVKALGGWKNSDDDHPVSRYVRGAEEIEKRNSSVKEYYDLEYLPDLLPYEDK